MYSPSKLTLLVSFLSTCVFTGLFAWSFVSWQNEKDAREEDDRMQRLCTKLKHLTNDTGATIAWLGDGTECQLVSTVCSDYLSKNGIGFCTQSQRRRLQEGSGNVGMAFAAWAVGSDFSYFGDGGDII